jgi:thiamine-phosphate pyrophosphorylase
MKKSSKPAARPQRPLLRVLDANANRLREGLRVVEDLARFLQDDAATARRCKALRHQVTASMRRLGLARDLLAARDSVSDLGRGSFGAAERSRARVQDVLLSNLHRGQESARVLEELAKLLDAPAALSFKRVRYALYDLEKGLLR